MSLRIGGVGVAPVCCNNVHELAEGINICLALLAEHVFGKEVNIICLKDFTGSVIP